MNIAIDQRGNSKVAIVGSAEPVIRNVQDALDVMVTVFYNHECEKIVLSKSALTEEFFDLKTRLAGDILQKYMNYRVRLAIVGNFSGYTSKSLRDFMYESNQGKQVFFLEDQEEALQALHRL